MVHNNAHDNSRLGRWIQTADGSWHPSRLRRAPLPPWLSVATGIHRSHRTSAASTRAVPPLPTKPSRRRSSSPSSAGAAVGATIGTLTTREPTQYGVMFAWRPREGGGTRRGGQPSDHCASAQCLHRRSIREPLRTSTTPQRARRNAVFVRY